jgi:hypothetical protein
MLKTWVNSIFVLVVCASVFSACHKDMVKPEVFIASPDTLINIIGKDWDEVNLQLNNKVVYGYDQVPDDQVSPIKAVVSLPVIDTSIGLVNCSLILNVDSATNKVVTVFMQTIDSLPKFGKSEAYALMLHYCNEGIKLQTDSANSFGTYGDGMQVTTTIDDLLSKLNSGFDTNMSMHFNVGKADISLVLAKTSERRYTFSLNGHVKP